MTAHPPARSAQLAHHPRAAVASLVLVKDRLDLDRQGIVFDCALRILAAAPGVKTARRNLEDTAQHPNVMPGLLRENESKSYRWCLAKKAAAFFAISSSSVSRRFSLRSRF